MKVCRDPIICNVCQIYGFYLHVKIALKSGEIYIENMATRVRKINEATK